MKKRLAQPHHNMSSSGNNNNNNSSTNTTALPVVVYVLVRTSDRDDRPPHYECGAESEVVGVYTSYRLAYQARRVATADMEPGSKDEDFHRGTNCISTFEIFAERVLNHVDTSGLSDDEDDESSSEEEEEG